MNAPSKGERVLSLLAGFFAAAAGASLSVSHIIEGGQPLLSPLTGASVALSFASAVAAIVAGSALAARRHIIAFGLILIVAAGEIYALTTSAEHMLLAREHRSREAAVINTARSLAIDNVKSAETIYTNAEAASAAEASRGGCGKACRDLRQVADEARSRLETARAALMSAPASKSQSLLADTLGIDPRTVEIVPSLLFSFSLNGLAFLLLAFGAHAPVGSPKGKPNGEAFEQELRAPSRKGKIKTSQRGLSRALGRTKSTITRQIRALAKSGRATIKTTRGLTLITFNDH